MQQFGHTLDEIRHKDKFYSDLLGQMRHPYLLVLPNQPHPLKSSLEMFSGEMRSAASHYLKFLLQTENKRAFLLLGDLVLSYYRCLLNLSTMEMLQGEYRAALAHAEEAGQVW